MFDKFDVWQYRDNHNCWDYVREFLIDKTCLTHDDVPKFGVSPDDKKGMTTAYSGLVDNFVECEPLDFSIACHFYGRVLVHVGIVYNGKVLHTGRMFGLSRNSIERFSSMMKTKFYIHRKLWQG